MTLEMLTELNRTVELARRVRAAAQADIPMKYGPVAGNKSINATIYRCFKLIEEDDQRAFVKKFQRQPHDGDQVLHTFRELLLGAFLASNGFRVAHERPLDGKTPDWSILTDEGQLQCIVEGMTFHCGQTTERKIMRSVETQGTWFGYPGPHDDRLHCALEAKASAYKALVEQADVAYVIGVFAHFHTALDADEVREVVLTSDDCLFVHRPQVSGVLLFEEASGPYRFSYIQNPSAHRSIDIPSGLF